jgi:hypothetical protein
MKEQETNNLFLWKGSLRNVQSKEPWTFFFDEFSCLYAVSLFPRLSVFDLRLQKLSSLARFH